MITSHHMAGVLRVTETVARMGGIELVAMLRAMVERSGLMAMGEVHADLVPQGASCVVLLAESHVAIHAWPEYQCLTVDIHVCDYKSENLAIAESLAKEIHQGFATDAGVLRWHTETVRGADLEPLC